MSQYGGRYDNPLQGPIPFKVILIGVLVFFAIIFLFSSYFVINPGHRGVLVTLGKVSPAFAPEGLGFKMPLITDVIAVSVRQQTAEARADCYSSDLQQIMMEINILYRIPESEVVRIFKDYSGDPLQSLIVPRVAEAIKEITALMSAEQIVKKREEVKVKALASAKLKIGSILSIEDIVIKNVALSKELEQAIEAKMVQEQEAAKAKFIQQKAEIEANTAIIRAKGEAEAISIKGKALRDNPTLIQLNVVEKWNGVSPLVIGSGSGGGSNIILPLDFKTR